MLIIIITLHDAMLSPLPASGLLKMIPIPNTINQAHLFCPGISPYPWYHCTYKLHPPQEADKKKESKRPQLEMNRENKTPESKRFVFGKKGDIKRFRFGRNGVVIVIQKNV